MYSTICVELAEDYLIMVWRISITKLCAKTISVPIDCWSL